MRGFSLIELMVSLLIFALLMAAVARFAGGLFTAREVVDRGIALDSLRWYIRDSLDCRRTLQEAKGSTTLKPPFNCAEFPRGSQTELIARPPAGTATKGARISEVLAHTPWTLRWYCSDNVMNVEVRPRRPLPVDKARLFPPVKPSDVQPIRVITSEGLLAKPKFDSQVGFAYLKNAFGADKPERCPPTSSLGGLVALIRFAANTVLNSAPMQNTALEDMKKAWGDKFPSLQQTVHGQLGDLFKGVNAWKTVGGGAWAGPLEATIGEAQNFAGEWFKNLAVDALKKSGEQVLGNVVVNVATGKGIGDVGAWGQAFAVGAVNHAAGAVGAPPLGSNILGAIQSGKFGIWEIAANGPVVDSSLPIAAKVPLQMFVAMTDIEKQIEAKMQNATKAMVAGLQKGLPESQVAKDAVKATWGLESYLKDEAPQKFAEALDKNFVAPTRKAAFEQVDSMKKQMSQKFDKMQTDLANSAASPAAKADLAKKIEDERVRVLAAIEATKAQIEKIINDIANGMKAQFAQKMAAIAGDGKTGIKAIIQQYLKDLQAGKKLDPATVANQIANQVLQGVELKFPALDPGKLIPPDPGWRDLFEDGSHLCASEFQFDPMRDFADNANPCGVVMDGQYPIMVRTHNGRPICCKEVGDVGRQATCGATEVAWMGGAECSSPSQPLLGQGAVRNEFLPALQGRGLGLAVGLQTLSNYGGLIPWPNPPAIHPHNVPGGVNAGGKVAAVMTVGEVYAGTEKYLGGFLRSHSPLPQANEKVNGQTAACYWANKSYSRHGEWSQEHDVTTKTLCCPMIGY